MGGNENSGWFETILDDSEWFGSLIDEIEYSCEETVQRIGAFGCDMMELWSQFSQRIVDLDLTRHSRNFIAGEEHLYDVIPVTEVKNRPCDTCVSDGEEEEEEETDIEHWATSVSKIPESLNQDEEDDGFDDKNSAWKFEHTDEDEEEMGTDDDDDDDDGDGDGGDNDDYVDDDEVGFLEWLEGCVDVKEAEISIPFTDCDWVFVKRIV